MGAQEYGRRFANKVSYFGKDTYGHDVKAFGNTTGRYMLWDASADELILTDNVELNFGTANDAVLKWDATNLTLKPVADDTGAFHIGDGTTDFDVKVFLSASTKYVLFDVGNALLTLEDVDLKLGDNDILQFGDAAGGDVSVKWNATNLVILPAVDDTGAIHFGDGTTDMDVKVFLNAATKYVLFDVGGALLTLEDVDLHLGDNDAVEFGDAATGDVRMLWNATNLVITPAVDDTGVFMFGDGTTDMDVRMTLGAAGDYLEFDVGAKALELVGDARIDLSGATLATGNTDGGVIKAGTSSARVIEDTAGMNFIKMYWDCGATSGTAVGLYNRLYVTGVGGSGQATRFFCTVEDVAAGNAYGTHTSLSFAATGSITGLGTAGTFTLHIPDAALGGGTYAGIQSEIYSDGANSNPATATELSFLRCYMNGNGSGADTGGTADVDDKAYFAVFAGGLIASGNMIQTEGDETKFSHKIRCKNQDGTDLFLMACAT